eukprot:3067382-Amphidinium_carterae.3
MSSYCNADHFWEETNIFVHPPQIFKRKSLHTSGLSALSADACSFSLTAWRCQVTALEAAIDAASGPMEETGLVVLRRLHDWMPSETQSSSRQISSRK